MKALTIAALLTAQAGLASQPAFAASTGLRDPDQREAGTFAGARFRIPFGGKVAGNPNFGIGIAGMTRDRASDGAVRLRFSEGVQLGNSIDGKMALSIGGRQLDRRLTAAPDEDGKKDGGISTLGIVGIVVGGVLVIGGVGLALLVDAMNDASE
jgi:hypothetical protein